MRQVLRPLPQSFGKRWEGKNYTHCRVAHPDYRYTGPQAKGAARNAFYDQTLSSSSPESTARASPYEGYVQISLSHERMREELLHAHYACRDAVIGIAFL